MPEEINASLLLHVTALSSQFLVPVSRVLAREWGGGGGGGGGGGESGGRRLSSGRHVDQSGSQAPCKSTP